MTNNSYKDSAFLIKLRTTQSFRGTKKDVLEEREIMNRHELNRQFHDVRKHLLPPGVFRRIEQVRRAARDLAYKYGYPWDDQGYRILAAALYPTLTEKFNELYVGQWLPAVAEFMDNYEGWVEEAVLDSRGIISYEEFPAPSEIHFEMSWDILPLPIADDFRFQIPQAQRDAAMKQIQDKINDAHRNNYTVMQNVIKKFVEFTTDPDKSLKGSSFREAQRLAEEASLMNFLDDPFFDDVVTQFRALAANLDDPERVRKDKTFRASLGDPFKKLQEDVEEKMSGLFAF